MTSQRHTSRPFESLAWLPTGHAYATLPAGEHWDAVRITRTWARHVLRELGDASGAVIEDDLGFAWYWLIAPGSAHGWHVPAAHGIEIRGTGTYITVPALGRPARPHWLHGHGPLERPALTDPDALNAAIQTALGPRGVA